MSRQRRVGILLFGAVALVRGAIFPDQIGDYVKSAPKSVTVPDQALYGEYGLDATEQADYAAPTGKFTATAWRFKDSTGAMAMFQLRRPPGAVYTRLADLNAATSDGVILAHGNYVFQMTGKVPAAADLNAFYAQLAKLEQSPMPALIGYLPSAGLVPNSERYIVGPVSLERFAPEIPPSAAAFHLSSEGQYGKYKTPKGVLSLVVFNFPSPNLARDRFEAFQKLPGVIAKRTGSLVAAVTGNPDPDDAERLLSNIKYDANITWNEKVPGDDLKRSANMILAMFALAGLLILGSIIAGIGFGGFKVIRRKLGGKAEPDAMITLGLDGGLPLKK
jgi:hypothetical protein